MQHKLSYFWGILGKFVPQALYLVSTMVLARFIDAAEFGKIGVLSIIFSVASVLQDAGLGGSLVKEKSITKIDCSTIGVFNVVVSIIIYSSLFFSSKAIENYFGIDGLSVVVKILGLVFPISAFGLVPKALLQRSLSFQALFYNSIITVIVSSIIAIIIAIKGGGVFALVAYQLAFQFMTVITNSISSRYLFSLSFSVNSFKRLFSFGFFTSIISIIDTIYENIMTSMTGKYLSVQQAGYLYQAKRVEETLSTSLATSISTVAFPVLTKLKDDINAFFAESYDTFKTFVLLLFPVLISIAVFSKEIIVLLFGESWINASLYLELLVFAGVFLFMETLIRNFIKALCEVKKLATATLIKRTLGIVIILTALLINPEYMIYAYIFSSFLGFVINSALFRRITNQSFARFIKVIFFTCIPCLALYLVSKLFLCQGSIFLRIIVVFIVWIVYYFIYLPFLGVKLLDFIKIGKR